jgi:hypothetical protein
MEKLYLIINAAVYAALAVFCTARHGAAARGSGYTALSDGGHSEYLTVYGGLQLGLAVAYAWTATNAALIRPALIFSVCLYLPIVIYRVITVFLFKVRSPVTLGTGALEFILLVAALVLTLRGR